MKKIFFIALVGALILTSCGAHETAHYKIVETTEFAEKIEADDVQIIDVRTADEFDEGHLENAINIDVNAEEFSEKIEALDKSKATYIYCRSGVRSGKAGKIMEKVGFEEIYDLKGGIKAWDGKTVK